MEREGSFGAGWTQSGGSRQVGVDSASMLDLNQRPKHPTDPGIPLAVLWVLVSENEPGFAPQWHFLKRKEGKKEGRRQTSHTINPFVKSSEFYFGTFVFNILKNSQWYRSRQRYRLPPTSTTHISLALKNQVLFCNLFCLNYFSLFSLLAEIV